VADDLVQETFYKAWANRKRYMQRPVNLKGWLFVIMRNHFVNNYRKSQKLKLLFDDSYNNSYLDSLHKTPYVHPESLFAYKEIQAVLNKMEAKYKKPLKLFISGYKYKEIAEKLGANLGTIKSRIFISRRILNTKLAA
jgi:RNA polymerase sigma factor (sigma-70 family)